MKFRTEISTQQQLDITHKDTIISIGSCFSTMIGERLEKNKFNVLNNPFGTVYNPISIFEYFNINFNYKDFFTETDGVHLNFKFHSQLHGTSKSGLLNNIDSTIQEFENTLKKAQIIIITLGTSFVYKLENSNEIVANCHKKPATIYKKELLEIENIIESFHSSRLSNFKGKIIFTISPVRYINDSFTDNFISKSVLRCSIDKLMNTFKNIHYFPSYELMLDDLRDYRFYKEDLIHPNEIAEKYIWEKFMEFCMNNETKNSVLKWEKIQKSLNHKSLFPESESHQKFLRNLYFELIQLNKTIDCERELTQIKNEIK